MICKSLLLLSGFAALATAQFPPPIKGVTTLKSKFHENVTISYKEPGICETTPDVKSYAGHIHIPPGFLDDIRGVPQDYPMNTFFWFFESRKDPENAPLAIWLNGGPGGSSLMGLLEENGPCFVNPDQKSTRLNPWSWNNEVNMLFLDQPNQAGFSYDVPTNVSITFSQSEDDMDAIKPIKFDDDDEIPQTNLTYRLGTLASQDLRYTANSTAQAAHALWHFAQTWFAEFPHYKPHDDSVSLWAESYGGHYGPSFMRFFQQQNERILNGTIDADYAHYLHLDTLGIIDGLIDTIMQSEAYIQYPFNNTYGIQVFNQSIYDELMHNFTKPGGCKDQLIECRDSLSSLDMASIDPLEVPSPKTCPNLQSWCNDPATNLYNNQPGPGNGWYDISHPKNDPFPAPYLHGYLTEASVLEALGSPVNYTAGSTAIGIAFYLSRDILRGDLRDAIAYLLDSGVKVHMMYGDRDYACNWIGGEKVSLAIPYSRADDFSSAGYQPLVTLGGDIVHGMTRQFGNYSFSRVFQAGHEVPSYQPEAAYNIFMRAMFNKDISTGLLPVTDELSTVGPSDTWFIKNKVPEAPKPRCYVLVPGSCDEKTWARVEAGNVTVIDNFVVDDEESADGVVEVGNDSQQVIGDGEL